jgi:hypothetical protein
MPRYFACLAFGIVDAKQCYYSFSVALDDGAAKFSAIIYKEFAITRAWEIYQCQKRQKLFYIRIINPRLLPWTWPRH